MRGRRKTVFSGHAFDVTVEKVREPGGRVVSREVVRHGPSAVILAFDERGRVLLVRQYRHPAGGSLWELPAGGVEDNETPFAAAKRELREETGFAARKWKKLIRFFASPGFLDEEMHVFVAHNLVAGVTEFDPDERIRTKWFAVAEVDSMIRGEKIRDGKTLAAWAAWRLKDSDKL